MAKTIVNAGYEKEKQYRAEQLEWERQRRADIDALVGYEHSLGGDRKQIMTDTGAPADKYGFAFVNGYGKISDKDFKEQLTKQYQADGLTSVDAQLKANIILAKERAKYESLRQALYTAGLIDETERLSVPSKAAPLGVVSFNGELPAAMSVADYMDWSMSILDMPEDAVPDSFEVAAGYVEFGKSLDNGDEQSEAQNDSSLFELPDNEDENSISFYGSDEPLEEPVTAQIDKSVLPSDAEGLTNVFHEELVRYANGEMSDFEKNAFKSSVANGVFGEDRRGLAESLDYLAFGSPTSSEQVEKIAKGFASKYDDIVKRGVPDALNSMPLGFDPEYRNDRGMPEALQDGLEGHRPGIDYEADNKEIG